MWFTQRIVLIVGFTLLLGQGQSAPIDSESNPVDDIFDFIYEFFESVLYSEDEDDCDDERPSKEDPTPQSSTARTPSNTTPVRGGSETIAPTTAIAQTSPTAEATTTPAPTASANAVSETTPTSAVEAAPIAAPGV